MMVEKIELWEVTPTMLCSGPSAWAVRRMLKEEGLDFPGMTVRKAAGPFFETIDGKDVEISREQALKNWAYGCEVIPEGPE